MELKNFIKVFAACFLYIVYTLAVKFNVKSKYFKKKYDSFSIKHLHSNHPKRLYLHVHRYSKIRDLLPSFLYTFDPIESEVMNEFHNTVNLVDKIEHCHFIFIGDSHVEFLSRIRQFKNDRFCSYFHAVWLGPATLLGLGELATKNYVNEALERIDINPNCKKIYLVWSFGTIDVRTSIYELMVRKLIQSDDDIEKLVRRALEGIKCNVLEGVLQDLSARYTSVEVTNCFMAASNSFFDGSSPKTVKEVSAIRKAKELPVLGSIKTRKNFSNIVNSSISSWCDLNKYVFCDPYLDPVDGANLMYMRDGIHLTEPQEIRNNASELVCRGGGNHV